MNRLLLLFSLAATVCAPSMADETTFKLAQELMAEKDYTLAAVEFRRFALESAEPAAQSSSYLYAGYAYLQDRNHISAGEMFDRAENADEPSAHSTELALLNAENARLANDAETALYFYDVLAADSDQAPFKTFALRRAAALHLAQGDLSAARQNLERSPMDKNRSLQALEAYAGSEDKSPLVGGLLGLIPGAGYWYSGEVANGFRSLILNSLFIYGMVETAQEDQWGGFAVITFFELTWYSGSIYGGIDAAQRYNRERLESTLQTIEGDMKYRPDPSVTIPLFKLNFEF